MKIYCYSRCSTCKKALAWLDERGIKYELLDIKEQHPGEEELRAYHRLSGLPLKKFFNTSGMVYKSLNLKDKLPSMTEEEQYALLESDGKLVKRPIIVQEDLVLVGFNEEQWQQLKN